MVDVIKSLQIEHIYSNPASSFRGLHESLINYGKNTMPDFITCMHEESSVAMAHGYFKATGKPQMMLCHGTVGLQHAVMSVYNAWVDRVPVILVGGNDLDAAHLSVFQYPGPQGTRPSDLAARLRISKQALNYLLGQLERLDYLERRPDPDDLRSKRIALTRRGLAACDRNGH